MGRGKIVSVGCILLAIRFSVLLHERESGVSLGACYAIGCNKRAKTGFQNEPVFSMCIEKAQQCWTFRSFAIVSIAKSRFGGDEGDRTPYLLNAIQALYQVSYAPIFS